MSSPSFFFPGSTSTTTDKKDVKPIENPLLVNQKRPIGFSPTPTQVPRRSPTAGILTTLSPSNTADSSNMLGLRNRKAPTGGPRRIPKASYSLNGGGLIGTTTSTPSTSYHRYDRQSNNIDPSTTLAIYDQNRQLEPLPPPHVLTPTTTTEVSTTSRRRWLPCTTGGWILVYGFVTSAQYDQVVQTFSSFGNILDQKGSFHPGRANWIALQYESQLEAEKAVCHNHLKLLTADGGFVFCGVKRLEENDPILLQAPHQDLAELWKKKGEEPPLLLEEKPGMPNNDVPLDEKDILLSPVKASSGKNSVAQPSEQSVCEKFARWLFSVP